MFVQKYTNLLLIITAAIFAVALGIIFKFGIPFGIDFTGGALTEVAYDTRPDKAAVEASLATLDLGGYSLRGATNEEGKDAYILRTRDLQDTERQAVEAVLVAHGEGATVGRFTSIGPVIGQELAQKAMWALGSVVLMIVLYVAFVFRHVSKPVSSWVYGGIAIFVLVHDVLVPTAMMSLLGYFMGAEADVLFIMALLAVLGYSVNDTIVVFDRVRENLLANQETEKHEPFGDLVERSVKEAFARSVNTSLTTLLALGALFALGGDVTKNFALVLMVGILAGTYSSIWIANPLLIAAARRQAKKPKKEVSEDAK